MASYSNSNTGDKPADPYKAKNIDQEASIKKKVEDLSTFITSCKFGMMTTRDETTGALVSRCMALAAKENDGIDLIFHTNTSSGKTSNLESDPHTNISFLTPSGEWASVSGTSIVDTSRASVKKYYTPTLKAWVGDLGDGKHDGGPEDPRIGVIRVETKTATYSLQKGTVVGRAVEVAKGVVGGKTADVMRLVELDEGEIETWRASRKMVQ